MSEDNVYSIYIDDIELSKCIHLQEYYICSNTQTHYIQETDNCEAKLFSSQDKDVIPKACEIKITRIQKLIIHKLDNENVWLYTAEQPTTINIDCASEEPVFGKCKLRPKKKVPITTYVSCGPVFLRYKR